uniref:Protein kinase C-binding protein 1 n=1 Tax=Dendroctonus ponderosae TaxID=77166 RepID=A0AAR5PEM3_DENPD
MSEARGNDQNGGATKEPAFSERDKAMLVQVFAQPCANSDCTKSTSDESSSRTDTSPNSQIEAQCQSVLANTIQNPEGAEIVNNSTSERDNAVAKIDLDEVSSHSRELKSLLALSKEANLDTNIPRKRKSNSVKRKLEGETRLSAGKGFRIQYPVTAEAELEMELHSAERSKMDFQEDDSSSTNLTPPKGFKQKKSGASETSGESIHEDSARKNRKPFIGDLPIFKPNKDIFCWRCHKDSVNICCETCPRSYHQKCLKQTISDPDHWPCPECVSILKAESMNSRSTAMREMTLEHLCSLLKFAAQRMVQCQGSEPFIHAVNDNDFPEYKKYIIQPMNLTLLEKNIKENVYGSTQAFEADAKWILHNSIVFNSYGNCSNGKKYQSKLTSVAKTIIKICKQEMSEIENCPCCYLNANTKKKTWFVEVCPKPHLLVWAKLRGFPYWPGKAMSCKDGMVDVRFFGAHDRAWVPEKECFLYTPKDPNLFRVKRADIEQCVEELELHVENLKAVYDDFNYPLFKTPIDSDNELKQLQMFLPRYKAYFYTTKEQNQGMDAAEVKKEIVDSDSLGEKFQESLNMNMKGMQRKDTKKSLDDEAMEGYGTDDESVTAIDTEMRKTLLKMAQNPDEHQIDQDDTQVADTGGIEQDDFDKEAFKNISLHMRVLLKKSDSEPCSKRPSVDERRPCRRNSESKSNINRSADKISKVNISDDMEVRLGKEKAERVSENISSSNSECSSDVSVDSKKRPVQVDVDNVEFTISPARKLKMVDALMKRFSDGDSGAETASSNTKLIPRNLKKAKRSLVPHEESATEGNSVSSIVMNEDEEKTEITCDEADKITKSFNSPTSKYDGLPVTRTTQKNEDVSKRTVNSCASKKRSRSRTKTSGSKLLPRVSKSEQKIENNPNESVQHESEVADVSIEQQSNKPSDEMQISNNSEAVQQSSEVNTPMLQKTDAKLVSKESKYSSSSEDDDCTILARLVKSNSSVAEGKRYKKKAAGKKTPDSDPDTDEHMANVELSIDKANILNIIHGSLVNADTAIDQAKSDNEECSSKNTDQRQRKKRKASYDSSDGIIESRNKVLKIVPAENVVNQPNDNHQIDDKDECDQSNLKSSKKPDFCRSSPTFSKHNSTHGTSADEAKTHTEPEGGSRGFQDLEAKRKYLSALNILEKGEADAQKPKTHEIRTRSKTEEKRERLRISDNMSKTIEDVAANYSAFHQTESDSAITSKKQGVADASKADGCEIFVKSFAKIGEISKSNLPEASEVRSGLIPTLPSKQRARKSFPHPNYMKPIDKSIQTNTASDQQAALIPVTEIIPRILTKNIESASPTPVQTSTAMAVQQTSKTAAVAPIQQLDSIRPTNGYLILQPQQQDNLVFIPPNQTLSYSSPITNQVMSVTPCLVSSSANTAAIRHLTTPAQIWHPGQNSNLDLMGLNVSRSQNYIPQGETSSKSVTSQIASKTSGECPAIRVVNGMPELSFNGPSIEATAGATSASSRQSENEERNQEVVCGVSERAQAGTESSENGENVEDYEFAALNNAVHENVGRIVNDLIRRPPPKLKPRPPGALSQQFSEGLPSSAGPVTARVNSVAYRLGDYFRGMLIETLKDLGKSNNTEAAIIGLKQEIETLKHKHNVEISEIEKNMTTVLKDIQRTVIEERERVIEETRAASEAEAIKRVEETKLKQWCANCLKEAQFYCCWNTSYCDYPCQQKHWPTHMSKCSQHASQSSQTNSSTIVRPNSQQLILRPANPPSKRGVGKVFTKPIHKVYMNRNMTAPKTVRMQNTATNLLTMMETTPGNFQLVTTNAIIRTGPPAITPIKPANVISVSSINSVNQQQKICTSKPPVRIAPVTGTLDEESD